MAPFSIPVDLFNPGQVFACLGFLEAAEILLGDAEGGFDWRDTTNVRFHLRAAGDENPFAAVLNFLLTAKVSSIAPAGSQQSTEKWKVPTCEMAKEAPFPFPEPQSPATLPAMLSAESGPTISIDYWGEASSRTGRDNVKFWAGSGGYPGAALAMDALDLVRGRLEDAIADPFALSAPQSSSFRFDWRRDYIPMEVGFSPNAHGELTMVGFPLVELLAAIGLGNARPQRLDKLSYRYSVVGISSLEDLFAPLLLRAALGGAKLPFLQRTFHMYLGWPGQENQARCITDVVEEAKND
jgi:CRISPR-associated protein Csx14